MTSFLFLNLHGARSPSKFAVLYTQDDNHQKVKALEKSCLYIMSITIPVYNMCGETYILQTDWIAENDCIIMQQLRLSCFK